MCIIMVRTLNTGLNKAFFNKYNNACNKNINSVIDSSDEEFQAACEEVAEHLMILSNGHSEVDPEEFDISKFYDQFLVPGLKEGKYSINQLIEKYVVHTLYRGRLNHKFTYKYNSSPSNKLARLQTIKNYLNNPKNWKNGNFRFRNINDPDHYDLGAAEMVSNINWYTNSINNRISKYKKLSG